jgi:hypothetical protein
MKLGRNDPCHCGSGLKYKKCCLTKDAAPALVAAPLPEATEGVEQPAEVLWEESMA